MSVLLEPKLQNNNNITMVILCLPFIVWLRIVYKCMNLNWNVAKMNKTGSYHCCCRHRTISCTLRYCSTSCCRFVIVIIIEGVVVVVVVKINHMPCVYDANDHMVALHTYICVCRTGVYTFACLNATLYLIQIVDLNAYLLNVRPVSISLVAILSLFYSFVDAHDLYIHFLFC